MIVENKKCKACSVELFYKGKFDISAEERDIIRHNWAMLGYEYWFSEWGIERWRHPDTEDVVDFPN